MAFKYTQSTFISLAKKKHPRKYTYDRVVYKNSLTKVSVGCKHCDKYFSILPSMLLSGIGCKECGYRTRKNTHADLRNKIAADTFVSRATKLHKGVFNYPNPYINNRSPMEIWCTKCKSFFTQTPSTHLEGWGCNNCAILARTKTKKQFIKDAKSIHGNLYDYADFLYTNSFVDSNVICKSCGSTFLVKPYLHLQGTGCSCRIHNQWSNLAIKAIESYATSHRWKNVIHALTPGGEYTIPELKRKVDGYHKATNTVIQVHGDDWHGNPKKHSPRKKCHPFNNKTAASLYKDTMRKDKEIRNLGYNLIVMWELDLKS